VTATGKATGQTGAAWFTVATDWDQAGSGPSLAGFNPTENTITPAKAPTLKEKFNFDAQESPNGAFTPSIADGVAYVAASEGPLSAINATTGKRLWSFSEPSTWSAESGVTVPVQLGQPAVQGGTAFVSVEDEGIVAIGPGGKLLWQSQTMVPSQENDVNLSEPALANGVLYATEGQDVFAFSAASGAQLWYAEPTPWPTATPESCGEPAVSGGVLYLACGTGYVYALSATTGKTLWSYEVPGTPVLTSAVVSGGAVYATTSFAHDELYAISTTTHAQLWSFTAAGPIKVPAVAGNTVYAASEDGVLHALNASTGTQLWSVALDAATDPLDPYDVSVADGVVYAVSADEAVAALSAATGKRLWSYQAGNSLQTTPVVANGIVYIGTGDGGVEAFAPR
jgi:eukaryotic-like serine/threonine-protein kinase